jgi:glycosyltransferase involved in cell wall biosynthesis
VVPVYVELNHPVADVAPSVADQLKGKIVILTMARLVKQKNLPLLIRSFGLMSAKSPQAVLVVVGCGPEKNKLVILVEKLKLQDKVIFIDWTDNVYSYYELADIYALSSNYEGWGMVIVEAASCDLPIVMTDVGCANEVVKNNVNGLIVPIGDQEKLTAALYRLAADKELREKLGANAKEAILALPDQEQTLTLYKESWLKAVNK